MIGDLLPKSLLAAMLLGVFLPITGRHILLGRSVLLGLAVPQISMAGMALVFLGSALGWSGLAALESETAKATLGALVLSIPTLLLLSAAQRTGRQLSEAWLAVTYLGSVAATNLLLSSNAVGEIYLSDLFHGRLLLISDGALAWLAATLLLTSTVAFALRNRLLLALTDPDFAIVAQVRTGGWLMLLALLNGCVIGCAVAAVGPLVTFGFLILPALSAASLTKSLRSHLFVSMALGALAAFCGYKLAYRFDWPLGDCTVALATALLVVVRAVTAFRYRRGR